MTLCLPGSGSLSALFGTQGKDGAMGGIFGSLFEGVTGALGLGGNANAKDMNVTAKTVNIDGKGGAGGGIAGGAKGLIKEGVSALIDGFFSGFSDGGIVGARSGHVMRAPISAFIGAPHFARGGTVPGLKRACSDHRACRRARIERRAAAQRRLGDRRGRAPRCWSIDERLCEPDRCAAGNEGDRRRGDSSGGRRIDVVMDERVAAAIGSPQGQEALQAANGMGRRVARR